MAQAQIVTDGSVGAARALSGPAYVIPQSLGKLSGANLFQSFQTFNIGTGQSATFTTDTAGIANVISRVTGGSASQINGLLRLKPADASTPGFYFINPAGVVFGAGASIDVPGAFHVGTADYVAFPDGRFNADPQKASSFSSAPPEAFGFLGTSRAAITLKDGALLAGRAGQSLSISAGDVLLDNAILAAGAGSIRVAAVGQDVLQVGFSGALPAASGQIVLRNGAGIESYPLGSRAGGPIVLGAGRIDLDSGGYLYTLVDVGDSASSGAINVVASGALRLAGGASISADVSGSGAGGAISLRAASLSVDGQAYIRSNGFGAGAASSISVDVVGALALSGGGNLSANTIGQSDAGAMTVRAGSLSMASGAYIGSASVEGGSGRAGAVDLRVAGDAMLSSGASVYSSTSSTGSAGPVTLNAANLLLDNASIKSNAAGAVGGGGSGQIAITVAGALVLQNTSAVDTSTLTTGAGGAIQVRARDVTVDSGSRINSSALDGTGAAGSIDLVATGKLIVRGDGSTLSTGTSTSADAGAVRVSADSILLDSAGHIDSTAFGGSSGRGGDVTVNATGALVLQNGSTIGANTGGTGAAGGVQVNAGSVALDSQAFISSLGYQGSTGNAGRVTVTTAGDLSLRNSAFLSSDAFGIGKAGAISLRARNVTLDSGGRIASTGEAGRIDLVASGDLLLANSSALPNQSGQISTTTFGAGNGGEVNIQAANVTIDGPGAGVVSFASAGTGNAGSITVQASGELRIRQGGLSTSTLTPGAAGSVQVQAARVLLDGPGSGIAASALAGSGGQTGSVNLQASEAIRFTNGAFASISNLATVANPGAAKSTSIHLTAPEVLLQGASAVSADARGNVAASDIVLDVSRQLTLTGSTIDTSANTGNGGAIRIRGGAAVSLAQSQLTTSVLGVLGNGGDIELDASTLLLNTAFIQANTAARNASGGLVRISANALVASGNTLFVGGNAVIVPRTDLFGFNVIQAAAPTGVSGAVDLTSPVLDVTGSLRQLRAQAVDAGGLGRSLCQTSGGSSLALAGRGGLPPSSRGWLRAEGSAPSRPTTDVDDDASLRTLADADAAGGTGIAIAGSGTMRPGRGCL